MVIFWHWALSSGDISLTRHCAVINKYVPGFSFSQNSYSIIPQAEMFKKHMENLQANIIDGLKSNGDMELVSYLYGLINLYDNSSINCYLAWFQTKRKIPDITFSANSFNDSIRRRLLCNKFSLGPNITCICKKNIDPIFLNKRSNMFHNLSCAEVSGCTIARHNSVVSLLNLFIKTFIPFAVTQFEYVYINPVNNSIKKRIDFYIKLRGNGISGHTIFFWMLTYLT